MACVKWKGTLWVTGVQFRAQENKIWPQIHYQYSYKKHIWVSSPIAGEQYNSQRHNIQPNGTVFVSREEFSSQNMMDVPRVQITPKVIMCPKDTIYVSNVFNVSQKKNIPYLTKRICALTIIQCTDCAIYTLIGYLNRS